MISPAFQGSCRRTIDRISRIKEPVNLAANEGRYSTDPFCTWFCRCRWDSRWDLDFGNVVERRIGKNPRDKGPGIDVFYVSF